MELFAQLPFWFQIVSLIGLLIGTIFLSVAMGNLLDQIKEWIKHLIYIYKYKHRFNKPPVARCYCKDCGTWNPHSPQATEGRCWKFNYTTEDNWFCWDAEPRKTERE